MPVFPLEGNVDNVPLWADSFPSKSGTAMLSTEYKRMDISQCFKQLLVGLHADFAECQSRISRILIDEDFLDQDNASDAELAKYASALLSRLRASYDDVCGQAMDIDSRQELESSWIFKSMVTLSLVDTLIISPEHYFSASLPHWLLEALPDLRHSLTDIAQAARNETHNEDLFFNAIELLAIFDESTVIADLLEIWLSSPSPDASLRASVAALASFYAEVPSLFASRLAAPQDFEAVLEKRRALASAALTAAGGLGGRCDFLWKLNLMDEDDQEYSSRKIDELLTTLSGEKPLWFAKVCVGWCWLFPLIKNFNEVSFCLLETETAQEATLIDEVFVAIFKRDGQKVAKSVSLATEEFGGFWFLTHLLDLMFYAGAIGDDSDSLRDTFLLDHAQYLSAVLTKPLGCRLAVSYAASVSEKRVTRAKQEFILRLANCLDVHADVHALSVLRVAVSWGAAEAGRILCCERFHGKLEAGYFLDALRWAQQASEISGDPSQVSDLVEAINAEDLISNFEVVLSAANGAKDSLTSLLFSSVCSGRLNFMVEYATLRYRLRIGAQVEADDFARLISHGDAPSQLIGNLIDDMQAASRPLSAGSAMSILKVLHEMETDILSRGSVNPAVVKTVREYTMAALCRKTEDRLMIA